MSNGAPFERFTESVRKALSLAQEEAQRFQHNYIGTEHLLLGLIREGDGVAAHVLTSLGMDLKKARSSIEFIVGRGDHVVLGELGLTPRIRKVIELAVDEARSVGQHYIGTEHLLLGLVREGDGIAIGVLESHGIRLEQVRKATLFFLEAANKPREQVGKQQLDASQAGEDSDQVDTVPEAEPLPLVQNEDDRTPTTGVGDNDPFNGFTVRARRVMEYTAEEARAFRHGYIGTEHLLLGLLREEQGIASHVLRQMGVNYEKVHSSVTFIFGQGNIPAGVEIGLVPRVKSVIALARDEALRLNHPYVGTEHLLLGLVREGEGPAIGILESLGVRPEHVRVQVIRAISQEQALPAPGSLPTQPGPMPSNRDEFDSFTEGARRAMHHAQEEAQHFQHNYIGTEHLLLGLIDEGKGVAVKVLNDLGIAPDKIRSEIKTIGRGDRIILGEIGLTPRAKKSIELAVDEVRRMNHHHIGTEHLLLGLVREEDGIAGKVLRGLGATLDNTRAATIKVSSSEQEK